MKKLSILLLSLALLGGVPVKGMMPESTAGKVALAAGVGLGLYGAYRWFRCDTRVRDSIITEFPVAHAEPAVAADGAAGAPAVDLGALLIKAAQEGNQAEVARLIADGANVNHADCNGITALISAAFSGHTEIVQALLKRGANVNHAGLDGMTALMCATGGRHAEVVRVLLAAPGIAVNNACSNGWTALIGAAVEDRADVVHMLLEAGADVNHADCYGWTALMKAAYEGHAEVVRMLLQHRVQQYDGSLSECVAVDPTCVDNRGYTALHLAINSAYKIEARRASCVRALLYPTVQEEEDGAGAGEIEGEDEESSQDGESAYGSNYDSDYEDDRQIRRLIRHGVDPNARVRRSADDGAAGGR